MLREAKSTARILKGIHKKIQRDRFYVLKDTFKALAGRGNLRNVYLQMSTRNCIKGASLWLTYGSCVKQMTT